MNMIIPHKLLCIFAHPDDEAFGPGGSIAHYARLSPVHLICVTDGDGGGDKKIGTIRKYELAASAQVLGVENVSFLGFQDGSLNNNNYHAVANKIEQIIHKFHPDTLMTFDSNGVTGHLDHIAVSMISSYLFERTSYLQTLMYFCEGEYMKEAMGDYFVYVPPGYRQDQIDLTLNVQDTLDLKISAMKKHVSQKEDCDWILDQMKDRLHEEYFRIIRRQL